MSGDVKKTDPRALAQLMSLGGLARRIWRTDELRSILEHQMESVVQFDLGNMDRAMATTLAKLAESENLLLKSFRSLFEHPSPPVELLILTKDFAKANVDHPDSPLPDEIARVLYYESILVAQVRCGRRITSLDDASLRQGVEWAVAQPWLDDGTRKTLQDGLSALDKRGET